VSELHECFCSARMTRVPASQASRMYDSDIVTDSQPSSEGTCQKYHFHAAQLHLSPSKM
jgi:hypothetical protein